MLRRMACAGVVTLLACTAGTAWGDTVTVFSENFEGGLANWTPMFWRPENTLIPPELYNDWPQTFVNPVRPNGPNSNYPGGATNTVAGYSSALANYDGTAGSYLKRVSPNAAAENTYLATLEMDAYVYFAYGVGCQGGDDPWALGNRVYLVGSQDYEILPENMTSFDLDYWSPNRDLLHYDMWPTDTSPAKNGIWQHVIWQTRFYTTGYVEVRLVQHDKHGCQQAVAWDNVTLALDPAPANDLEITTESLPDAQCQQPYSFQLEGTGVGTLKWSFAWGSDPPDWLQISSSGLLTGTPGVSDSGQGYTIKVRVNDVYGPPYDRSFFLYVASCTCDVPIIDTINPSIGEQDSTTPMVTITGSRLGQTGNTTVWMEKGGVSIPTTAAAVVAGDGLSLTCQFAIPADAATGPWDVFVETASGCRNKKLGGFTVNPKSLCPPTAQDADNDQDVDLVDFGQFQACFNGPNRPYKILTPEEARQKCVCIDQDSDDDVDLVDFGAFQRCFNGPNRAPKC